MSRASISPPGHVGAERVTGAVLGFDPDFGPFTLLRDGRPAGAVIDIIEAAVRRAAAEAPQSRLSVELKPLALALRSASLEKGELDGWAAMAVVPGRQVDFLFSRPLLGTGAGLFRPVERPLATGEPGRWRIATPVAGPLADALAQFFPKADVVRIQGGYLETLLGVLEGQADVAALNYHAGAFVAESRFPGCFVREGEMFARVQLAVGMWRGREPHQGDAERVRRFLGRFDEAVRALALTGGLTSIVQAWGLGQDPT